MPEQVKAASRKDILEGQSCVVRVKEREIAVFNVGGVYHAIDNVCLHRGGPLGGGVLNGKVVTCPWHGWEYDVTTGKVAQNPAVGVSCYKLEICGEDIFVDC